MYASAPERMQRSTRSIDSYAEIMMTETELRSCRIPHSSSYPEKPSIITSESTRLIAAFVRTTSSASLPLEHTCAL